MYPDPKQEYIRGKEADGNSPMHGRMKTIKYSPNEEPELVSDCCSAAILADNMYGGVCSYCHERCEGVPLDD